MQALIGAVAAVGSWVKDSELYKRGAINWLGDNEDMGFPFTINDIK